MADRTVEVQIKAVDKASSTFKSIGKALAVGLGVVTAAGGAAMLAIKDMVSEASAAEQVSAKLGAVLKSTGGAAGVTAEMANDLANSLMNVTRFEDEAILEAETLLLRFKSIGKDIFPEATKATLDLAESLGIDANSAAKMLGKALETPGVGLLRLKMAGVAFNEEQLKMIQGMAEAGDLAGAQRMILDELKTSIGGTAEAMGSTMAGKMEILKNKFGNLKETIGGALLPVLTELLTKLIETLDSPIVTMAVDRLAAFFTALPGVVGGAFAAVQSFYRSRLAPVFAGIQNLLNNWVIPAFKTVVEWSRDKISDAWNALRSAWTGTLQPALQGIWKKITEDVLPAVQAFIKEGWARLQEVWGKVKGWYDTKLAPVFAGMYNKLTEDVIPKLKEWAQWTGEKLNEAWGKLQGWYDNTLKGVLTGLYDKLVNEVIPKVKEWAQWTGEKLGEAWTKVQGWWNTTLRPALDELYRKLLDEVIPGVRDWVKQLQEDLPVAFAATKAAYDTNMKPVFQGMIENMGLVHEQYMVPWSTFLTTDFPAGLTILGGALQTNVLDKLTILSGLLPDVGDKTSILAAAWDGLQKYIVALNPGLALGLGLFTLITDKLTILWQYTIIGLTTAFVILGQKIDAFIAAWQTISTVVPKVMSALDELPGRIVHWAAGIVSQFEKIGGQIVEGMKTGISKGWDSFKRWLVQKVESIVASVLSALGIHSPSAVFAEIGFNMVAGLQQGWQDGMSAFTAQVGRGLSMGVPSLNLAGGGGGSSSTSYNSVGGDTYNVSVNDQTSAALLMAMVDERRRARLYASMGVGV